MNVWCIPWADPDLVARRGVILVVLVGTMSGVMITGLDQPIDQALGRFGHKGLGYYWGVAAYWLGLGGIQLTAGALFVLAALGSGRIHRKLLDVESVHGARMALAVLLVSLGLRLRAINWRRVGLGCLVAVGGSGLAVQVVKHLVGRARPSMGLPPEFMVGFTLQSELHSFPSGHAATSFAMAAWLSGRCPKLTIPLYTLAAFVAVGRVISGAHYASDVLGGTALGLAVGWALDYRRRRDMVPA